MIDGAKRKAVLYPFQTSLILLLPEVFEVASNMRDNKSSSISKKVSFLEMLRKSLRNRNETAIFCLTSVLRVARHFNLDSDAAILSYTLDVQEEVREAVFRRSTAGTDSPILDTTLISACFVTLAHLNFEHCVESLAPFCLAPNAAPNFKLAVLGACSHFARQPNAQDYQPLFLKIAEFIRSQLKVRPQGGPWSDNANIFQMSAAKARDSYPDEQYTLLKPPGSVTSSDVTYCIFAFLDASPMTLYAGAPSHPNGWAGFVEEVLTSYVSYLVSDDDRIRYIARAASHKLLISGTHAISHRSEAFEVETYRANFWKAT